MRENEKHERGEADTTVTYRRAMALALLSTTPYLPPKKAFVPYAKVALRRISSLLITIIRMVMYVGFFALAVTVLLLVLWMMLGASRWQ